MTRIVTSFEDIPLRPPWIFAPPAWGGQFGRSLTILVIEGFPLALMLRLPVPHISKGDMSLFDIQWSAMGVSVPLITRPAERHRRNEFDNPFSKVPLILGGLLFLLAGIILPGHRDLARSAAWLAIGAGMILYGVTDISLRRSPLRVPALLVALALWFGGVYWALNIAL